MVTHHGGIALKCACFASPGLEAAATVLRSAINSGLLDLPLIGDVMFFLAVTPASLCFVHMLVSVDDALATKCRRGRRHVTTEQAQKSDQPWTFAWCSYCCGEVLAHTYNLSSYNSAVFRDVGKDFLEILHKQGNAEF